MDPRDEARLLAQLHQHRQLWTAATPAWALDNTVKGDAVFDQGDAWDAARGGRMLLVHVRLTSVSTGADAPTDLTFGLCGAAAGVNAITPRDTKALVFDEGSTTEAAVTFALATGDGLAWSGDVRPVAQLVGGTNPTASALVSLIYSPAAERSYA